MEEQIHSVGVVVLAGGLGALIGIEREFAGKPAGLRTHIFVAAAAAMLMLLSDSVMDRFQEEDMSSISADPIRIIQAIVVGISFLGAGTIIHHGDHRVEGLTTASSILLTAGIGIAVALGKLYFAVGVTASAVVILTLVGWLEGWISRRFDKQAHPETPDSRSDQTES